MLPFCFHRGLSNGEKPLFTGFFTGAKLLPLAPCKSILNTFVYEIYQRVFILFELSVKHTLSDFLLPFRCHTIMATIWLNQLVENKFKIILFSNNESLFVKPFFIIFTPINKVVYIFF